MTNDVLQIRVDKKIKSDASIILDNMGLDMSTTIRIFLNTIVKTKSIPFDINIFEEKKDLIKKSNLNINDLNKYMNINMKKPDFQTSKDIDKYIKESRRERKFN